MSTNENENRESQNFGHFWVKKITFWTKSCKIENFGKISILHDFGGRAKPENRSKLM